MENHAGTSRNGPQVHDLEAGAPTAADAAGDTNGEEHDGTKSLTETASSGAYSSGSDGAGAYGSGAYSSDAPSSQSSSPVAVSSVEEPSGSTAAPASTEVTTTSLDETSGSESEPAEAYTPVADPPFGLTMCEEQSTAKETSCVYSLRCDGHNFWTGCDSGENDSWQCTCLDNVTKTRLNYDVSGANPEEACKETFVMCLGDSAAELSDMTCDNEDVVYADYACARKRTCTVKAELKPGLVVSQESRSVTNTCSDYGGGFGLDCNCGGTYQAFHAYGLAVGAACAALDDLCGTSAPTTGERRCTDYNATLAADWCATEHLCGAQVDLMAEGAYALVDPSLVRMRCEVSGGNTWCECQGTKNGDFRVLVDGESLDANCLTTEEVCLSEQPLQMTDELSCDTLSVSAFGESCTATSQCRLQGELAGQSIVLLGDLYTQCLSSPHGEWSCGCSSGLEASERFTLAGIAGFDVCDTAKDVCAEMVSGLSTRYGYYSMLSFDPPPLTAPLASSGPTEP